MTDPIANADPPLRAHMSVPYDAQSLDQCIKDAYDSLTKPTRWRQDFLGLQYRTLCLPKELVKQGFAEVSKVVDVSTMAPLDPAAHPDLTRIMDFATRAGVAALMLYRNTVDKLDDVDAGKQDWSISYYRSFVRMRAEKLDVDLSLDDLRFLAATSTLRSGAGAPKRDWPVLMQDDTKWCLVAPRQEWPDLIETYPQTHPFFEASSMLKDLVSPPDALRQVWYSPAPAESLALPDLDNPSP